jgi:hypothetical protein
MWLGKPSMSSTVRYQTLQEPQAWPNSQCQGSAPRVAGPISQVLWSRLQADQTARTETPTISLMSCRRQRWQKRVGQDNFPHLNLFSESQWCQESSLG